MTRSSKLIQEDDVHHVKSRGNVEATTVSTSGGAAVSSPSPITSLLPLPSCHPQCFDRCHDDTASGCYRCKHYRLGHRGPCVENCGYNHFVRNETVQDGQVMLTCENCHFSCASCSGPSSTDCLQCPPSSFLDAYHQCLDCASPCQNCSGAPTVCTSCVEGFRLEESTCLSSGATVCDPGTYLDLAESGGATEGVGPGKCLSCHESCATCTGRTINECLTCPPGALLQNRSTCVQTCDTGYYEAKGYCFPCTKVPTTCLACIGPEVEDCKRCPTGWEVGPKGCTPLDCGSRQFLDVVQGGICSACHASCLTCKGPQFVDCLSCASPAFLHKGKCVQKCPKSTYPDQEENHCQECDASCKACNAPGGDIDCTSCYQGHVLFRGVCLSGLCGTGYYQDANDKKCKKCDDSCLTCKGPGPGNCVTCQPGPYALHRPTSKCVPCCMPNTFDKDACCICRNPREKNATCVEGDSSFSSYSQFAPADKQPVDDDEDFQQQQRGISSSSFTFLVTLLVLLILLLPVIVFVTLQAKSNGWLCFGSYKYTPLDRDVDVRGLNGIERITLTEDDLRDEDELSDAVYVAPQYKDRISDRSPLFQSAHAKESNASKSNDSYSNGISSYSQQQRDPSSLSGPLNVPLIDKHQSSDLHYT